MKRFLAYLFIVLGLGLTFNVSANAQRDVIFCQNNESKSYSYIANSKKCWNDKYKIISEQEYIFTFLHGNSDLSRAQKVTLKNDLNTLYSDYSRNNLDKNRILNIIKNTNKLKPYLKIINNLNKTQTAKKEPSQTQEVVKIVKVKDIFLNNSAWQIYGSRKELKNIGGKTLAFIDNNECRIEKNIPSIIKNINYKGSWNIPCSWKVIGNTVLVEIKNHTFSLKFTNENQLKGGIQLDKINLTSDQKFKLSKGKKTQIAKAEPSQTQKVAKKEKKKSKWITKKTTTEDKTIKSKTNKVLGQEKAKITTDKRDNDAPILIVDENITVNSSSYSFIVKAKDKGSEKIFIQVDGVTSEFKDGIFKIDRFSPVNEKITIVAIDQWGNKSKAKTVNIKVDIKDTIVAKKIEKLNPSKLKVKKSRNKVALIIGIEDYSQSPNATFANLDAKYFYEYASKGFGVKKENIKLMIDKEATLIKSIGVLSKWLPSRIKSGETELIIFFAGHGLASNDGKDLFLLSQDSDPDLLARTALSRTELFKEIIKLNPKSVTMFLDTCYSGVSRDEKTLLASARPVRIIANEQDTPDNFTIFSASQLDQISSGLKDAKHGIFSYYLMKGLEGKADLNKDRNITNGELLAYMDENVAQKASELGRQQNPSLSGNENKILLKY